MSGQRRQSRPIPARSMPDRSQSIRFAGSGAAGRASGYPLQGAVSTTAGQTVTPQSRESAMQEVVGKIVESHLNIGLALGELFHLVVSSLPPVSLFQTSNNAVGGVLPTVQISTGTPAYGAAVAYSVRTTARYDPPILQLKQPSGPTKLYLGALYGPGAAPITDVTFRPKADGSGPEISIVVPPDQPAGLYTGIVLDSDTGESQGTLQIRVY
jgi:hypothetical protein